MKRSKNVLQELRSGKYRCKQKLNSVSTQLIIVMTGEVEQHLAIYEG